MTSTDDAAILASVGPAMRRVLADIDTTTPYRPTMRIDEGDEWPLTVVCWGFIDSATGRAIVVDPAEGEEHAAALLADEMSEEVPRHSLETTGSPKPPTWPHCPRHEHALDPVVVAGRAVWRCRDDAEVEIPIGSLRNQ